MTVCIKRTMEKMKGLGQRRDKGATKDFSLFVSCFESNR